MRKNKRPPFGIGNLKPPRQQVVVFLTIICVMTLSCVRRQGETLIDSALHHEENREFSEAIYDYEKAFKTSANKGEVLVAAQKIQELSFLHTKDYKKAVYYLNYYIANIGSFHESMDALKRKAYIEHKILNLYDTAIATYYRLLNSRRLTPVDEQQVRLEVARCLYAINQLDQAQQEIIALLQKPTTEATRLTALLLQATIYQAAGNTKRALEMMDAAAKMPDLNEEQIKDVAMNRSILFEHEERYADALAALETLKNPGAPVEQKKEQLRRLAKFQRSRRR
ncbi:MAG: hypothetical protein H6623_03435 [Bdellovibrionaceae bacterium]|nr:hypothetical protein [Pseudobdellovibrionaceae bacterium]